MTLYASAKRHLSLLREDRIEAAIESRCKLFVCKVVKNTFARNRIRERQDWSAWFIDRCVNRILIQIYIAYKFILSIKKTVNTNRMIQLVIELINFCN